MILYTAMQLELVLDGLEKMEQGDVREVEVGGSTVLVRDMGDGKGQVLRLLSTDPREFLRSDLRPGALLEYKL